MKQLGGTHLLIDGYVEDPRYLAPGYLCMAIDNLVNVLGMEYLQRPSAHRVPISQVEITEDKDDGGWSAVAQVTTSHLAIHGWPLRKGFMADVSSCRVFDFERATEVLCNDLRVVSAVTWRLNRFDPRLAKELNADSFSLPGIGSLVEVVFIGGKD